MADERLNMRTIRLASALISMLLTVSPMKGQLLRELLHDVQKGLQKDVDKELSSSAGDRFRKIAEDILRGTSVSDAIAKQLESVTAAVAIQMTMIPALDHSLTLADRKPLKQEFTGPLRTLADRYAAKLSMIYTKRRRSRDSYRCCFARKQELKKSSLSGSSA